MLTNPFSVEAAVVQHDVDEEHNPSFLELGKRLSQLLPFLLLVALEEIIWKLQMVLQGIIRQWRPSALDRCEMKWIVPKLHLPLEIFFPLLVIAYASRKNWLFPEFSQLVVVSGQEDHIASTIACGYGAAKRDKCDLEADNTWQLLSQFCVPCAIWIKVPPQTNKVVQTCLRSQIKGHLDGQYIIKAIQPLNQQNRLMIIGNFRSQSKPNIRLNSMYKRE